MNGFQDLRNIFKNELEVIDKIIIESVAYNAEKTIEEVSKYLLSKGKRIRAILTLIGAQGSVKNEHLRLASAVELIHAATLLHDDVIDNSMLRRSKPTANSIWDNKTSILVGDFLFSKAFEILVSIKNLEALAIIAEASSKITAGEIKQNIIQKERTISLEIYYDIIQSKTSCLFEASICAGAAISEKSSLEIKKFGNILGTIYQITDDTLDYFAEDSLKLGKNVGDDFYEGKFTLPIILACQNAYYKDREFIIKKMESNFYNPENRLDKSSFDQVIFILKDLDIPNKIRDLISLKKQEALMLIQNKHFNYMNDILDAVCQRIDLQGKSLH